MRLYCDRHQSSGLKGECPRCIQEERDQLRYKLDDARSAMLELINLFNEVKDWGRFIMALDTHKRLSRIKRLPAVTELIEMITESST